MPAKPFASAADTSVKEQTLEVLAAGVYALTAQGDPNVGAIEGEDFLVCFEALATPVAAATWLARLREHTDKPVRYLVLSHYHAVRVLGASAFRHRRDRGAREQRCRAIGVPCAPRTHRAHPRSTRHPREAGHRPQEDHRAGRPATALTSHNPRPGHTPDQAGINRFRSSTGTSACPGHGPAAEGRPGRSPRIAG